jgi:type II secretory pathway component PulL
VRIGFIDLTDGKLHLYIFEKKGSQHTLIDTISVTIEGELNQSSLASLVKTNIEHVYLSLPVNLLSLRELSFPFSDKNKIKDTISYELEGILLGNIGDYSIDYLITESSDSGSRVLAACMEKTKLRDTIDLFSSVGLEPVVITSLDLRLSSKNIEMLFKTPTTGEEIRAEAAREELVNPTINLRQEELAYKGDIERIKKSLRFTGVLVLLLMLILGSYTTIKLISLKKENALLKKEMNTIYHDAFPEDTKIIDAVRQFKGNLNSLRGKKTILGGMPVLDILLNIANLKNKNIILSELNIDGENILIKGSALSFENVDSFKNALSSSFTQVRVIDSRSSSDKKISFSMIMGVYDS